MTSTSLVALLALHLAAASPSTRLPADYLKLKQQAEQKHAQGAYQQALELYQKASPAKLPPAEKRWIEFRLADASWRSTAAAHRTDSSDFEKAIAELTRLASEVQREQDRDLVWAEVQESLGDYNWLPDHTRNWYTAWQHYQLALDWWAGSSQMELARRRYLRMAIACARPPWRESDYTYGYYGNELPFEVVENLKQLARSREEQALVAYLWVHALQTSGEYEQLVQLSGAFDAALRQGRGTDWYDDLLYGYAQFLESQGRIWQDADGNWMQEPDFARALEIYRRIVKEFKPGQSAFVDEAKERIASITEVELSLGVSNVFLPGSEAEYSLSWRNLSTLDLSLTQVELTEVVQLKTDDSSGAWLERIELGRGKRVKAWTRETKTKPYTYGSVTERLPGVLAAGAYVLEVRSGKHKARDLVLVTEASVVLKSAGSQMVAYVCDALGGAPLPRAKVTVLQQQYRDGHYTWKRHTLSADDQGLAALRFDGDAQGADLFVAASHQGQQAFTTGSRSRVGSGSESFKIYVFTDRPAYRPEDEVQFKFIVRTYQDSVYRTPSGQVVEYQIADPRGAKVSAGTQTLNAFGSGWGTFKLDATIPLGEYRIDFWNAGRSRHIGSAVLFRLEEYKLPEFLVAVKTPEKDGQPRTFRVGDSVEAEVQVDYYFGGAVANAEVEVVVYQAAFYPSWRPTRDYPWYYADIDSAYDRDSGYGGSELKRLQLKTDAQGTARVVFDTPRGVRQDLEYRIEARVTDSSRREVVGSGRVRVTQQSFYVFGQSRHLVHRPSDKVVVDFTAQDANEQPRQVEGTVTVSRDWWYEIWTDSDGKEYTGAALNALRKKPFPPTPGWRLKTQGYQHDEVLRQPQRTGKDGKAAFSFVPKKDGYYRVEWRSVEKGRNPIVASTMVWVASLNTAELGYYQAGLEIILDSDTARVGHSAPILIATDRPGRHVLFTAEGDDLYQFKLLRLDGTVQRVELDIVDAYVPNLFVGAAMVHDTQLVSTQKQIVVPPVEHFLDVEVRADRPEYQPRAKATLSVITRDHQGTPVSAEVALGLVDESVFYIQQEYAADPRQFFFGTKRGDHVRTSSTFGHRSYIKLGPLVAPEPVSETEQDESTGSLGLRGMGRGGGGMLGDMDDEGGMAELASAPASGARRSRSARPSKASAERLKKDQARPSTSAPPSMEPAEAPADSAEPAVQVRTDFRATALFKPDLVTDKKGKASIQVTMPDTLTRWKATARAVGQGSAFGLATSSARTRQPLIVRLQAPRFFVVGDVLTLSAVVNNNTRKALDATVELGAKGLRVDGVLKRAGSKPAGGARTTVRVPAEGEARVDWQVTVREAGDVSLRTTARGGGHSDAMEKSFFAWEHGVQRMLARAGKLRGDEASITLKLPKRRPGSTALSVQVAPSQVTTMLDALPYLIDYPYGCTEQTMSRFLPAVIVARTLRDLGLKPEAIMGKVFGGIEQEFVDKTHKKGKQDLAALDVMVQQGLDRLVDFQHSDGGWGWWKDGDSDRFMTAYVVWGLSLARGAGITLKSNVLERAVHYLNVNLVNEERDPERQAWLLHAVSTFHAVSKSRRVHEYQVKAFDNLFTQRTRLSAYSTALLTLAAHNLGHADKAKILVDNLQNGVLRDQAPDTSVVMRGEQKSSRETLGTAHWGEERGWWRWHQGAIETTAFVLRALVAVDPKNPLIEPTTNWLAKNRRGAQWSNTRDTAIAVLALSDALRASGELGGATEYEVLVNGKSVARQRLSKQQALVAPGLISVDSTLLKDGDNTVVIRKKQGQALYFFARADFFSLEEPIPPAGNELFVRRQYYRWAGRPTLLKGKVVERRPLNDGDSIASGERVEVVVTVETKNDYEYLIFEDLKPAGFEAVEVKSGQALVAREIKKKTVQESFGTERTSRDPEAWKSPLTSAGFDERDFTGRSRAVYQELRDRKVALFVDQMGQGIWELRYTLRAEVPGTFHALPLMGHAMYVPEIKANGAEVRVRVTERP
ncbi:MAG: alpha-2-macroglobulin family protein [Pseudomonadota bacterium]